MAIIISLIFFLMILGGMGYLIMWQIKKTDPKNNDTSLKTDIETAQEFLPFHDISDSIINLGNHEYRTIIEVSSINYTLKTHQEKDVLELSFQKFLNSMNFPFSFFIHTKTVDNKKMLDMLNEDISETLKTFPQLEDYGVQHYEDMANIQDRIQTTKQKKKYIIVPYNDSISLTNLSDSEKYMESAKELHSRCTLIIENLESMGLRGNVLDTNEIATVITSMYHRTNYSHIEGVVSGDYLETFVMGNNKMANVLSEGKLDLIILEAKTKLETELLNNRNTHSEVIESVKQVIIELEIIRDTFGGYYKSNGKIS